MPLTMTKEFLSRSPDERSNSKSHISSLCVIDDVTFRVSVLSQIWLGMLDGVPFVLTCTFCWICNSCYLSMLVRRLILFTRLSITWSFKITSFLQSHNVTHMFLASPILYWNVSIVQGIFLCYICLVHSDEADVLDCFGTLIIIQSLSAVPVGVAQSQRQTCQLFCSHMLSDLLSHN